MGLGFFAAGLPARDILPPPFCPGIGLEALLTGMKLLSSTWTKLDGNNPIARLSRRKRPIHQEPSPAFRHSIKSPSTNPRSLFVSPPHEYIALHQHGNRVGKLGVAVAISVRFSHLSPRNAPLRARERAPKTTDETGSICTLR